MYLFKLFFLHHEEIIKSSKLQPSKNWGSSHEVTLKGGYRPLVNLVSRAIRSKREILCVVFFRLFPRGNDEAILSYGVTVIGEVGIVLEFFRVNSIFCAVI